MGSSPETTRHTIITSMINAEMEIRYLAQLVCNSPEIIYKHYIG